MLSLDMRFNGNTLSFLNLSAKFLEEEIFVGRNFHDLVFDRKNYENFCLAKISRYTVFHIPPDSSLVANTVNTSVHVQVFTVTLILFTHNYIYKT